MFPTFLRELFLSGHYTIKTVHDFQENSALVGVFQKIWGACPPCPNRRNFYVCGGVGRGCGSPGLLSLNPTTILVVLLFGLLNAIDLIFDVRSFFLF